LLTLLAALALALTVTARAGTQPATIPISDIGARATANYQGDALGVTATADGARLRCGFQKLDGHATPEGLWLQSTKPGAAGRLRVTATALSRGGLSTLNPQPSTALPATGKVCVADKLVRFTRPGLTEEYSVSVDGVRQDFIIESPPLKPPPLGSPKRSDGGSAFNQSMRVVLALSGARAETTASGARLRLEGSGRTLAYSRLRVEDATGRELSARLEVLSANRLAVSVADANATYPVRIDPTFSDADWVSLNPGLPGANGTVRALAVDGSGNVYAGGDFTFIGTVPANYIAKWDGSAWSALGSGMSDSVYALAVSGTNLYAGGYFDTAGGVPVGGIAKWDGIAWSALGSGMNSSVDALALVGTDLYAGGGFNTAGGVPAIGIAKWNGSAWSALGSGMGGSEPGVLALAVSGTTLYAAGPFTTAGGVPASFIAKWDGSAWSALGSGMGGSYPGVRALAVSGTNLYAGGVFSTAGGVTANGIAKWDGSAWSALGSVTNGWAYALAVSGTDLYVGGSVATAAGMSADYIAKWDGSAWSAPSSGMVGIDGSVSAVAVSGTVLYAGGQFTTAGGVTANYIAKWDGHAWSALGSGMDYAVQALAVSGTDLYAGGGFSTAGGVSANHIAKWNGSAWSALGSGMNGGVNALAVSGTNLYAGGSFTTAGAVSANNIAKWDGRAWSALGSGMNNTVLALAVSGTNLYAGGQFGLAGQLPANNIAKWDGRAWSTFGSGMNGTVNALAASGANLYAGGYFYTAGGVTAYLVAKWDGSGWQALGSGIAMDSTLSLVRALGVSGTDLYVGGWFDKAGGVPANCIAKWDGSVWSALGSGISGGSANTSTAVNALAADRVGHLIVGGNFSLAGTNASPYIAEAIVASAPTNVPVIVASPASLAVASGSTADFQVEATGSPPLLYQWVFNGTNAIDGATSAILSLTNVQLTQAGAYSVTVSNLYGAVTSAPAWLQVFPRGIVVTNSEAALLAAMTGGGTITFACDGTITLASTLNIVNDTTLDGSGRQVTISGNSTVRVFSIATNVHFTVVNVTIADGASLGGSAILNLGGTVNLSGVTFRSNTATLNAFNDALSPKASGGAIFNRGGTVNASNCSFASNTAQRDGSSWAPLDTLVYGGAIRNEAGLVALRSCAFVGNQAVGGAASDTGAYPADTARGGAIHNSGTATLDLCTLAGNSATGGSSAQNNQYYGLSGGEGSGGAIFNEGTLTTDRTTLCGNAATGGEGAPGCPGQPPSTGGRGADALGAAICNVGSLWVTRSTLASNVVTGGYGGNGGTPRINYSGNPSPSGGNGGSGLGGALRNSGVASLVNCTIASNTGSGGPGGCGVTSLLPWPPVGYVASGGNGGDGGSGFGGVDGTCNLINCTVAWNQGSAGSLGGGGGGNPPGTNGRTGSAWGGTTCGPMVNTLIVSNTPAGGDTFTDPKLGPLADNGGPTLTMALLPGSPAIDAGNTSLAPATDQRGFSRPAGRAADIGAFEYGSVMSPIAVSRSGATGLSIMATGNAGRSCRLLSSTNLSSWVPIATNQVGSDGTILFNVNFPPGSPCQFYRLVMP
jgi:hypothetical protein